jgi:hypothetical protein
MTLQELQKQVLELPTGDRWALFKALVESFEPAILADRTGIVLTERTTEDDELQHLKIGD